MIKSMTGFGKQLVTTDNNVFRIEVRTLNSKQSDINIRVPYILKEYESEIRNSVNIALVRGKVDVTINYEKQSASIAPVINHEIAKHYYDEMLKLSISLDIKAPDDVLALLFKMPDILSTPVETVDEKEWALLKDGLEKAIGDVDAFRVAEGEILLKDFIMRIETIQDLLLQVDPLESARIERIKERIMGNLTNFSEEIQVDKNRFEQELIYYIEKLDITEEKVRLKKHCDYFLETLKEEDVHGKKLGFISQEIGREINTMGAKANDADIQKIIVLMKDELEKIKEQLFNIL